MKWETRRYWSRNASANHVLDQELSRPIEDITDAKAEEYMGFLTMMGYKRHEHGSQIFFDKRMDAHAVDEVIFYR